MSTHFRPLSEADADTELDAEVTQQLLELWPGRLVDDRYEIQERIASGGMGAVYIAKHIALGKYVALKTIHPNLVGDADLTARFAREAMTSAMLEHPHVASALDYGRLPEGAAYIVFQLVRGKSIHELVSEGGPLEWRRACLIAGQIADALVFAHSRKIIHRDLKPENILLEEREDGADHARILDFGVARVEESPSIEDLKGPKLTRRGVIVGTPGYMPPEQALAEATDHRADIYSLGVVLWEMIAGKSLFAQPTMSDIVAAQISLVDAPTPAPAIPPQLQQLLTLMLAPKPDARPSSVLEVRDVLRDLVERDRGLREPSLRTKNEVVTFTGPSPIQAPPRLDLRNIDWGAIDWRKPDFKHPGVMLVAGGLSILLLFTLLILFWPSSPKPEPTPDLVEQIREQVEAEHAADQLEQWIEVLVRDPNRERRRTAATFVLGHEPQSQVPEWARVVAELEAAQGCDAINAALTRLTQLADAHTAAPFHRYRERVTSRRLRRFYRCIDDALDAAEAVLPSDDQSLEDDGTLGAEEFEEIQGNVR